MMKPSDLPQQSAVQAAFAPYSVIEQQLRRAAHENRALTINGLYNTPDVMRVVRDKQQVRDIISAFQSRDMVSKRKLKDDERGDDRRETVGYFWNMDFNGEGYRPSLSHIHRQVHRRPSEAVITRSPEAPSSVIRETPKAVELVFKGVTLTISKNEATGNTRIVIEG